MLFPSGAEFIILLTFALFNVVPLVLFIVAAVLAIRWFLRNERTAKDPESVAVRRSLGEVLKSHRDRCRMTQEFVAQHVGVSRQAVSKWEQGKSEPSTSNLVKLAHLFEIDPAELLREIGD